MTDVFREVDEEVRRDKAAEYWKKHGNKLIAVAVIFVASVGAWRYYEHYRFQERAALGAEFEAALAAANGEKPEATAQLTTLAEKRSGGAYAALARFRLAAELAKAPKDAAARADAASAFDALASDAALSPEWRDLARLRAAFVLIDHANLDEIEKRLSPLVTPAGNFRHSAREGIALAAFRLGQAEKAMDALQAIILDSESPANLRQRAEILLAVVRAGPIAKP